MTAPRAWTDEELHRLGAHLARLYLEVERGLRPRAHLRPYLSPEAYGLQFNETLTRHPDAGPVRNDDLGQVTFTRATNARIHMVIPARVSDDRWSALMIELNACPDGRWHVTELTRAEDRNLTRHLPSSERVEPRRWRPHEREHLISIDMAYVQRAIDALEVNPSSRQGPNSPSSLRNQQAAEGWSSQLTSLRNELRAERQPTGASADPVERLLGAKPEEPTMAAVWSLTHAAINRYRQAASITETHTTLGPEPRNAALRILRQHTVALIHDAKIFLGPIATLGPERSCEAKPTELTL